MMDTLYGLALPVVFSWLSLFITGRIFCKASAWEDEPATMKEDALASLIIVLLTLVSALISHWLLGSLPLYKLVYWGLIYFAFQLNGIAEAFSFYIIHLVISYGLIWIGIMPIFMIR